MPSHLQHPRESLVVHPIYMLSTGAESIRRREAQPCNRCRMLSPSCFSYSIVRIPVLRHVCVYDMYCLELVLAQNECPSLQSKNRGSFTLLNH